MSGLITIKDIEKVIEPKCSERRIWSSLVAGAVDASDTFERAEALFEAGADAIVIDTAHGSCRCSFKSLKFALISCRTLIAGNIVTAFEGARAL